MGRGGRDSGTVLTHCLECACDVQHVNASHFQAVKAAEEEKNKVRAERKRAAQEEILRLEQVRTQWRSVTRPYSHFVAPMQEAAASRQAAASSAAAAAEQKAAALAARQQKKDEDARLLQQQKEQEAQALALEQQAAAAAAERANRRLAKQQREEASRLLLFVFLGGS